MLSRLQELTGTDLAMYEALSRLLFMDPSKITNSMEEAASQASNYEIVGDMTRAEVWYRIAGGIALYKGDVDQVRKFFEKASSLSGNSKSEYGTIASRAPEAVSISRKYYENI